MSEKCRWIEWIIFVTRFENQIRRKQSMKKKLFAVMMVCILTFALAACGNTGNHAEESTIPEPSITEASAADRKSTRLNSSH